MDHVLISRAKAVVLRLVFDDRLTTGDALVAQAVRALGARDPGKLMWSGSPSSSFDWDVLRPYGEYHAARLATCEAIWQLVHAGLLLLGGGGSLHLQAIAPSIPYGPPPGQGGVHASINLLGFDVTYPGMVLPAPSHRDPSRRSLWDDDLFLSNVGVRNLHPLIDESLRQAVQCFRHELYLPCLAMLTRAIEGVWTIMGLALADFGTRAGDPQGATIRKELTNPRANVSAYISTVSKYYKKDKCDSVKKASGIERSAIDMALTWSDQVRDSRNVLHFANAPSVPIDYERVAVLLLATASHVQAMYTVKQAADSLP